MPLKGISKEFYLESHKPIYRGTQGLPHKPLAAHCPKNWYTSSVEELQEGSVPFELGGFVADEDFRPCHVTRRKAERTDVADFGSATDRLEANLEVYRSMSREERAEWIYAKTVAPYEPPFVAVEPRFLAKGGPWRNGN